MTGSETKAGSVVDALVKATVRSVLFPGLKGTPGSSSRGAAWTDKPLTANKKATKLESEADNKGALPFEMGKRFTHVLSYASWSDAQLTEERRRLGRCMKRINLEKRSKEELNPEQDEDEDGSQGEKTELQFGELEAAVLEACALLSLFQNERALATDQPTDAPPSSPELLHAQLDLYARYFEQTQRRKIQHEVDVLPVQNMYQRFLHPPQPGAVSTTSGSTTA